MEAIMTLSFTDFPEDVQLCILSFLRPWQLAAFAVTSKRFFSICREDQRLWFAMCDRRWGSQTLIKKWGSGEISYKHLYHFLDEYENLIGFWRRCGDAPTSSPPLVFFEWGPFYITGARISASKNGGYGVIKKPFLWMSITSRGEPLNYLDFDGRFPLTEEDLLNSDEGRRSESELIQVNVSFMGKCHLVVEENMVFRGFNRVSSLENLRTEEFDNAYGSPPDRLISEIYQYLANRTSPGGNGASRRQRKREKERQGKMRKCESEHFVKIVNCTPKPARPLQGLWKGISEDMSLDFYLVSYDDIGGIACRRVGGESSRPLTYQAPIFWTSSTSFIESPFSPEENHIYNSRLHLQPSNHDHIQYWDDEGVSRMLHINSSYDLVIPDLSASAVNSQQVEGRIWQYKDGTFGFGFLRDSYIIDLRHIARKGLLLDTVHV